MYSPPPGICKRGGDHVGKVFPVGGDFEADLPDPLKIILYGIGLSWCFLGVSIISDVFMTAISTICSQKKLISMKNGKRRTVKVWNKTVADLTLMALGSSAPEIMLNVIEVVGEFHNGPLGAGTIVGSAAVNLFVSVAVCMVSIPSPSQDDPDETGFRRVKDMHVFYVTASFSIFAYLWMIVVLMLITPEKVDVWEGLLTFTLFPMLVVLAYCADVGVFGKKSHLSQGGIHASEMTKEEQGRHINEIRAQFGPDVPQQQLIEELHARTAVRPDRAVYRRMGMAGIRRDQTFAEAPFGAASTGTTQYRTRGSLRADGDVAVSMSNPVMRIRFVSEAYQVMENIGSLPIWVERKGPVDSECTVRYRTVDGTAKGGVRFQQAEGTICFGSGESMSSFEVRLIDDEAYQENEEFTIVLSNPERDDGGSITIEQGVATVTVVNDDDPPKVAFSQNVIEVEEEALDFYITVPVERRGGVAADMSFDFRTEADSAVPGDDYDHKQGTLYMNTAKKSGISILIKGRGRYEGDEMFRLILENPKKCEFDTEREDTEEDSCTCTIIIRANKRHQGVVDAVSKAVDMNWGKNRQAATDWKEQFVEALVLGADAEEEEEKPGWLSWLIHVLALPWKFLFAVVPPTGFCHGWPTFFMSLFFIGLVTTIIGDLAMLFGCSLGLKDEITAITFVAMGTSLPDCMASRTAAEQDEFADASITNLLGSNSVNVFLGLGLPWAAGSLYWAFHPPDAVWFGRYPEQRDTYPNGGFIVTTEGLAFSVGIYAALASCALGLLQWRRRRCMGELGGPKRQARIHAAIFVSFYIIYVASSWVYVELA